VFAVGADEEKAESMIDKTLGDSHKVYQASRAS
jgi:hypothetical protein